MDTQRIKMFLVHVRGRYIRKDSIADAEACGIISHLESIEKSNRSTPDEKSQAGVSSHNGCEPIGKTDEYRIGSEPCSYEIFKSFNRMVEEHKHALAGQLKLSSETTVLLGQVVELRRQASALKYEIADRDSHIAMLDLRHTEIGKDIGKVKTELEAIVKERSALYQTVYDRNVEIDKLKADIIARDNDVIGNERVVTNLTKVIDDLNKELANKMSDLERFSAIISERNGLIERANAKIQALTKEQSGLREIIQQRNDDCAKLREDIECDNDLLESSNEAQRLSTIISERNERIIGLIDKLNAAVVESNERNARIADLECRLETALWDLQSLRSEREGLIARANAKIESLLLCLLIKWSAK